MYLAVDLGAFEHIRWEQLPTEQYILSRMPAGVSRKADGGSKSTMGGEDAKTRNALLERDHVR